MILAIVAAQYEVMHPIALSVTPVLLRRGQSSGPALCGAFERRRRLRSSWVSTRRTMLQHDEHRRGPRFRTH